MSKHMTKRIVDFIESIPDEEIEGSFMILGVEFGNTGLPVAKVSKIYGSAASALACITLMEELLKESKQGVLDKISDITEEVSEPNEEQAKELASKIDKLEKLGIMDRLIDSVQDPEEADKMKNLIKELKKRFGKQ